MSDKVIINNVMYRPFGVFSPNTDMSKVLKFGDGTYSANNVAVRIMGGAYVVVNGCMYYNPGTGAGSGGGGGIFEA